MFPDSGVPPSDAKNSLPDVTTNNCDELWYSTSRCEPRFDPAAANAMLAEDMNLIMRGEVVYQCDKLDKIERAVRYIDQRGMARGAIAYGGPTAYTMTLDPVMTRHNNYMTLVVIPATTNTGPVTLDGGVGAAYVLRWDGQHLVAGDWIAGVPFIISFYSGYWYVMRAVSSQILKPMTGNIDGWIRTDGNDSTGDGTANTPQKAFRTIQGAWNAINARAMLPSTVFSINLRLGIPGTYEPATIGPHGGQVVLWGDSNAPQNYVITQSAALKAGIFANGVKFQANGVTFEITYAPAYSYGIASVNGSSVNVSNCNFTCQVTGVVGAFIISSYGSSVTLGGQILMRGNGNYLANCIQLDRNSQLNGAYPPSGNVIDITNTNFGTFIHCGGVSVAQFELANLWSTNCVGSKYDVVENSIIKALGFQLPGNGPGTSATGGQFIP